MRISDYFTLKEIRCECGCGFANMSQDTLAAADSIRRYINHSVLCNSGCRCIEHNHNVGGAKLSRHLPRHIGNNVFQSDGMDLHLPSSKIKTIIDYLDNNYPTISYIRYSWGLHIDSRPDPYYKRA